MAELKVGHVTGIFYGKLKRPSGIYGSKIEKPMLGGGGVSKFKSKLLASIINFGMLAMSHVPEHLEL